MKGHISNSPSPTPYIPFYPSPIGLRVKPTTFATKSAKRQHRTHIAAGGEFYRSDDGQDKEFSKEFADGRHQRNVGGMPFIRPSKEGNGIHY